MYITIYQVILYYRCEALKFEMSKSQKKVIRRVTTFLKNGECEKNPVHTEQAEREPFMKCEVESNLFVFLSFFFWLDSKTLCTEFILDTSSYSCLIILTLYC